VTPATVRAWVGILNAKTPRINEHAYALLKTIFATAVQDELLDRNPCRERMRSRYATSGSRRRSMNWRFWWLRSRSACA